MIALKRFEFNFETLTKHKLNSYCEFPERLDMKPYTHESTIASVGSQADVYFAYRLKGVVIHSGTSDSGHYYSIIRNSKGAWFEFNDTSVRPFNFEDISKVAFGVRNDQKPAKGKGQ